MIAKVLFADRPFIFTVGTCLLPWLAVLLLFSTPWVTFHFLLILAIFSGIGYLVLQRIQAPLCTGDMFLFSPAIGFIVAGSFITIAVRHGVKPAWTFWIVFVAGFVGTLFFARHFIHFRKSRIPTALAFVILSGLVCFIYFLPGVLRDAVLQQNGGFNWMHTDTMYMTATAASVKSGLGPPKFPGLALAELKYHFGPYALSGALSAATGIELGDAVVRVVRGVALCVLLMSVTGLSRVLGRKIGGTTLPGFLGTFGLFFYGSLASLFANEQTTVSYVTGAILINIPYVNVMESGGPFVHYLLGHSTLYGMIALTAILGILLEKLQDPVNPTLHPDLYFILPGLTASINSIAGLSATGVVAALVIIFGFRRHQAWISATLTLVVLGIVLREMGYFNSFAASQIQIYPRILELWFSVFVWFFLGLGVRIFALTCLKDFRNNPVGWIMLLFIVGLASYAILTRDLYWGNNRYGFSFLQALFSVFGFVALAGPIERYFNNKATLNSGDSFCVSMLRITLWAGLFFLAVGLIYMGLEGVRGQLSGGASWQIKTTVKSALIVIMSSWILLVVFKRKLRIRRLVTIGMLAVYSLGIMAWITPWINFALGRMKMDIILASGETEGLRRLRQISGYSDLIATNRHVVESIPKHPERSYAYRALTERPILLEGWQYGEKFHPIFNSVKHDNDLLFSTTDAEIAKSIVTRYGINYIVARPGTDLSLPLPRPDWLKLVPNTGTLTVYQVQKPL